MRPAAPITAILISVITAPGAGMARARAAPSTRSAEREGYSNARGTAELLERSGDQAQLNLPRRGEDGDQAPLSALHGQHDAAPITRPTCSPSPDRWPRG